MSKKHSKTLPTWLYAVRTLGLAFAIFLGAQIAAVSILSFIGYAVGLSSDTLQWAFQSHDIVRFFLIFSIEALTVYLVAEVLRRSSHTFAFIGLDRWPKLGDVWQAIKAYVIYFVIFISIFSVVNLSGIIDTDQAQQLGFDNPAGWGLFWAFLSLVILPPLAEEILFRGYLFHTLKIRLSLAWSTIITSILFAIAHLEFGTGGPLNFAAALDTFVLSFVLVYVTFKTKSLWPAIFLHAIKNLIAFATLFVIK